MPKPPIESLPLEETCQYFEFLLKTANGAEIFPFTVPGPDARQFTDLFNQDSPFKDDCFIEFGSVPGRVVQLNPRFLVGVSRMNIAARTSDQTAETSPTEALILVVDGLKEPLTCEKLEPDWLEVMAAVLHEEPPAGFLSFPDVEELRTRFFPPRNIILMDGISSPQEPQKAT